MEAPSSPPSSPTSSFLGRNQFLIFRLFSMAGLFPIGAYFAVHLLTNVTVLDSPEWFQMNVDTIHSLRTLLIPVEWVFIFIPIMFHAAVGMVIISGGLPNTGSYSYSGNIRYTLQRATGMIAMCFIVWHVIHLHHFFGGPFKAMGGAQFDPEHATSSTATAIQAAFYIKVLYALGVVSCAFHFGNGLWTAGITWGVWTSPAAQTRASKLCLSIGLVLGIVGLCALYGFNRADIDKSQQSEKRHQEIEKMSKGEIERPVTTTPPDKTE